VTRRLVLVRHGQTAWNAVFRAQGHADISLDDTGRAQARRAAPHLAGLGPSRLWSSDLSRARETAEVIGAVAGLPVETDPRLREYDVGARSGLTTSEFAEQYPREHAAWLVHDESLLVPGEETSAQVRERVLPALRECLDALASGEVGVVVTHGACLKVGLLALLGWPPETSAGLRGMDNCGWTVIGEDDVRGGLRMVSYNETATIGPHPERATGGDFASNEAVG
jgi:broad specificity phosphatase PhoE